MQFTRIADKKRVEFIKSSLNKHIPAAASVLDIGCGNGIISKELALLGYHVTAIDVSERTIALAQSVNHHPNIHFQVVRAGELQPEPDKYDAIICSEVLEHMHDPSTLLAVIHTSLKREGTLIVTVPNGRGPREFLVTKPVQYLQSKNNILTRLLTGVKRMLGYEGVTVQSSAEDLRHVQFFTARSLLALANANGFDIATFRKTNFIEQVFPFSLLTKRSVALQKLDCQLAELLPLAFTSGFMTIWKKK